MVTSCGFSCESAVKELTGKELTEAPLSQSAGYIYSINDLMDRVLDATARICSNLDSKWGSIPVECCNDCNAQSVTQGALMDSLMTCDCKAYDALRRLQYIERFISEKL